MKLFWSYYLVYCLLSAGNNKIITNLGSEAACSARWWYNIILQIHIQEIRRASYVIHGDRYLSNFKLKYANEEENARKQQIKPATISHFHRQCICSMHKHTLTTIK